MFRKGAKYERVDSLDPSTRPTPKGCSKDHHCLAFDELSGWTCDTCHHEHGEVQWLDEAFIDRKIIGLVRKWTDVGELRWLDEGMIEVYEEIDARCKKTKRFDASFINDEARKHLGVGEGS